MHFRLMAQAFPPLQGVEHGKIFPPPASNHRRDYPSRPLEQKDLPWVQAWPSHHHGKGLVLDQTVPNTVVGIKQGGV